ncbi:Uncharacterised protein [Paenibacillus macerans]|nr:Uncharacterised protein [Paenibacillus macerans]
MCVPLSKVTNFSVRFFPCAACNFLRTFNIPFKEKTTGLVSFPGYRDLIDDYTIVRVNPP